MVDLRVDLGGLKMQNPIMPASGTFSEGLAKILDFERLGAFVTKTITRECRGGNPTPRVAETSSGMINSIGIPSEGLPYFFERTLPYYAGFGTPLVVSISAPTVEGFASLAAEVSSAGVAAIEANISCPNLEEDGRAFAMSARATETVIRAIRAATELPLWAKLTPNVGEIAEIARAAESAGADALVVANTILAMAIDTETFLPRVGNVMGGLSGPAIKPIIVRQVFQCARAVRIPIVGCGGIMNANDAVEYLLAGASAVQVGTASFIHPGALATILDDLEAYLVRRGFASIAPLIGAVNVASDGVATLVQAAS